MRATTRQDPMAQAAVPNIQRTHIRSTVFVISRSYRRHSSLA
jgi:hypothetical protein